MTDFQALLRLLTENKVNSYCRRRSNAHLALTLDLDVVYKRRMAQTLVNPQSVSSASIRLGFETITKGLNFDNTLEHWTSAKFWRWRL